MEQCRREVRRGGEGSRRSSWWLAASLHARNQLAVARYGQTKPGIGVRVLLERKHPIRSPTTVRAPSGGIFVSGLPPLGRRGIGRRYPYLLRKRRMWARPDCPRILMLLLMCRLRTQRGTSPVAPTGEPASRTERVSSRPEPRATS